MCFFYVYSTVVGSSPSSFGVKCVFFCVFFLFSLFSSYLILWYVCYFGLDAFLLTSSQGKKDRWFFDCRRTYISLFCLFFFIHSFLKSYQTIIFFIKIIQCENKVDFYFANFFFSNFTVKILWNINFFFKSI